MRRLRLLLLVLIIPLLARQVHAQTPAGETVTSGQTPSVPAASPLPKPPRPYPEIQHVLIISIDGLRPDRALWANMPTLRTLARGGSYTFWAKTTPNSITLPSHVSMLSGVSPRKHGIEWNSDLPLLRPVYPRVPTIFEMATAQGLSTAMVAGKSKFNTLNKPGTIGSVFVAKDATGDNNAVTKAAVELFAREQPDLTFIHFPDVDSTGHAHGWGSPQQFAAIEQVDECLDTVFREMKEVGMLDSTLVILSADHGGAGRSHGPDDARSRHIPWIAFGPGVLAGQDLTQFDALEVRTEDTAATACHVLGLALPDYFDGHPVTAIFNGKP